MKYNDLVKHILISVVGLVLFLPFLGSTHLFDWDEINFAEAAREMIISGNWSQVQINFSPFWEKPPLFFWMQALSMKIFGINEFAARFPNAICGVVTLNLMLYIGKRHFSYQLAYWWILFYIGSFTPLFYFKSGIIDPWFNLFIFLSLYFIFLASKSTLHKKRDWFLAGLLLGMAVITKGPVAVIIVGATVGIFWILNAFGRFFNFWSLLLFFIGILLIPVCWFLPETLKNGPWFLNSFLTYQLDLLLNPVASHGQPWFYHPVVLLIGCFPAGIFAISKFSFQRGYTSEQLDLKRWLSILFGVVLILFSIVTTKIVHYSSLCYLPLTFLAALSVNDWQLKLGKVSLNKMQSFLLVLVVIIWTSLLNLIAWIGNNHAFKQWILPFIKDDFAKANLSLIGDWNGIEYGFGLLFLIIWVAFLILYRKRDYRIKAVRFILIGGTLLNSAMIILLVPRIEAHSQRTAIEFYKAHANSGAIILTYKFKSYAQYFYGKAIPQQWSLNELNQRNTLLEQFNGSSVRDLSLNEMDKFDEQWKYILMHNHDQRPLYVVCQDRKAFEIDENNLFRKLYSKGGFVFYEKIR